MKWNDEEEMVTLEKIPENEDQELSKKPEIQSEITNFFQKKNIKCLFSGSMFQNIKAFFSEIHHVYK